MPDVFVYIVGNIGSDGTINTHVPDTAELPQSLQNIIGTRHVILQSVSIKLTAPKPPAGKKPFATLKTNKSFDGSVQLIHDEQAPTP